MKTIKRFSRQAFFERGPFVPLPVADLFLVTLNGAAGWSLAAESHGGQHLPHVARMIFHSKLFPDQLGDAWERPDFRGQTVSDSSGFEDGGKALLLFGSQLGPASDGPFAAECGQASGQPLLAPAGGGLAVDAETAGGLGGGDFFLKKADGLESALLHFDLIDGTCQWHAAIWQIRTIVSLYFALLNKLT
ncbi:MAG: hypothetical protein QM680_05990 [Luteolibacter sp.]